MQLVGRKITRETTKVVSEVPAILIANPINGNIKLSSKVVDTLNLEGKFIAFVYPDDKSGAIYLTEVGEKEGFKVSKGSVSSRFHSREIANFYETNKENSVKCSVSLESTIFEELPENLCFKIDFIEEIEKKQTTVKESELENENAI